MPPNRIDDTATSVKQIVVPLVAGAKPFSPSTANPMRNYYRIQNVGANTGYFWWDTAVNAGQAFALTPGEHMEFASKCPIEQPWFQSPAGTSFAVVEGIRVG